MVGALQTVVAFLMCWFLASSLWLYPYSLSYFNEAVRPLNGAEHFLRRWPAVLGKARLDLDLLEGGLRCLNW